MPSARASRPCLRLAPRNHWSGGSASISCLYSATRASCSGVSLAEVVLLEPPRQALDEVDAVPLLGLLAEDLAPVLAQLGQSHPL